MKIPFFNKAREVYRGPSPAHDWRIMLLAFALLFSAAIVFSGWMYYSLSLSQGSSESSSAEAGSFDIKAANAVVSAYEALPLRTKNLVSGGKFLVDPSR